MFGRIWNLAYKEFIQLVRDRMMTAFILLFPVAQLILLAHATGRGVTNLSLAVLDQDHSAHSRALAQTLDNLPELNWRFQPASQDDLTELIAQGQAVVGVVIPFDFGETLAGNDEVGLPTVQVIVDGSNSVVGASAQSAVESTIANYVQQQMAFRFVPQTRAGMSSASIVLRTVVRYNPDLNTRLFTIPAQMGFIVYQVTLAVASLAFARERELGTLEQLLVTPLRRIELISGKSVLAWLVGGLDFLLIYWVVVRVFAVPMRGAFALLWGLSLLFVAVEICYGVIISSFARTQQQAILYVFLLAIVDVALSGYLVPVKSMPVVFKTLAIVSPLQHYLVIVRAVMLKGAGLTTLWPQAAALVGIGGVVGLVALGTATRSLE